MTNPHNQTPAEELQRIEKDLAQSFLQWGQTPPEQFYSTTGSSATVAADMFVQRILAYTERENRAYCSRQKAQLLDELEAEAVEVYDWNEPVDVLPIRVVSIKTIQAQRTTLHKEDV